MDKQLLDLIVRCSDFNPENRPTIKEVLNHDFFNFGLKKHSSKRNYISNNLILEKSKENNQSIINSTSSSQESCKYDTQLLNSCESNMKI